MTYDEMMQASYDFYNTIDFLKFIPEGKLVDLKEVMDGIKEYYEEDNPKLIPKKFCGCFFNFVNEYEFGKYLATRYDISLHTQMIEKHYIWRSKDDD